MEKTNSVRILPISEKTLEHTQAAAAKLADLGVRLTVDHTSDKIGAKPLDEFIAEITQEIKSRRL